MTFSEDKELYPWQETGAEWLAPLPRAALLDKQGLGKTVTAIEAANRARTEIPGGWRIVVVCPSVVLWNWKREWELWTNDPNDRVQVISKLSDRIDKSANVVVLTHRALIDDRIFSQLIERTWNLAILDESHFFRNPRARRTQVFYGTYRLDGGGLTDYAQRVWCLTGTPMPNDVRNLWCMCWGLWRERFQSIYNRNRAMSEVEFQDRYAEVEPGAYKDRVIRLRNVAELKERLADVTLRRTPEEVFKDLPDLRFEMVTLRPDNLPKQLGELEKVVRPIIEALGRDFDPRDLFSVLKDLGEEAAFSTWRRLVGLAKVKPVAQLLTMELEDNHEKVVVFAHHKSVIQGLRSELESQLGAGSCVMITGDTTPKQRQSAVDHFQLDPGTRVALCNIVAGGTGVTLTESCEAVLVEQSFVPGENEQAIYRIRRIGQKRPCRVRLVSLAESIDELVVDTLRRKTRMIREVLS